MRKLSMEELGRKTIDEFKAAQKTPLVIVLDNVRSMHNVGSVFRTADAFLLAGIYLCGYTPTPPHREIQKTALGATETVVWYHAPTTLACVENLKANGFQVFAVEQAEGSLSLENFETPIDTPIAIVMGNEVSGVDSEVLAICDGCIEIPQLGAKHSLNISVATGIVVWKLVEPLFKQAQK